MKILKEHIKNKKFAKCYLFFGEEIYLKEYYEQQLKESMIAESIAMMNMDTFEGKNISVNTITDSADTLPFMSEKRLVLVKYSELLQSGRKEDSEQMKAYISSMPNSSCIVFIENNVDKRNTLYKAVQKEGYVIEFNPPKESELITWLQNNFKKSNKTIQTKTALYMLKSVGTDMELLSSEIQKLIAYKNNENFIAEADIDAICTKSLEVKIFDMLDAVGNKNSDVALEIYRNMISLKESPIKILTMIIRQFRLLTQTKYLMEKGYSAESIAQRLGQRPFIIKNLLIQVKNFSQKGLLQILYDCLNTDISIKTGVIASETAVELLLIKYSLLDG